jgi:exopolyphosphatase/pppGpp-phosphohydrolase
MKRPAAKVAKSLTAVEKIDAFGLAAICEAILQPKPQRVIAEDLGVSSGSLVAWIAADPERSARVREARAQTALMWDDKATHVIEEAKDQFELAKAKELAHHYRWRASKIAPREYGDKVDVNHGGQDGNPVNMNWSIDFVKPKDES